MNARPECANGCPPQQVCDHCAGGSGVDHPIEALRDQAVAAFDFSLPDPAPEPSKKPGLFDYVPFARMIAACRKIRFAPE